jgi:hypothetical protein
MNQILIKKSILLEDNRRREIVRTIVRDIVSLIKNDGDGEYYLPMDVGSENDHYEFKNFPHNLVVELIITEDDEMNGYSLNAEMFREDDLMSITLNYNPNKKERLLYQIIGELNETVAHEIRHFDQYSKKMFDFDTEEEEEPVKYYTDPKELDAQVFGFKRLSKLTRKPFEEVVRNWFDTHKEFHQMNDKEVEFVVGKILDYKSNL